MSLFTSKASSAHMLQLQSEKTASGVACDQENCFVVVT